MAVVIALRRMSTLASPSSSDAVRRMRAVRASGARASAA
eukprot:CAMPEP_0180413764 /NCGR_PEP_ID=MMETSP0989-20121125/45256_1 /TAXON_ID=697907 /ORGANISM="non described non described, Strain CCMP2293" /LENGTH=38 /DNA_ID= /DNA_START= /DNA_END= /DNA_ORIENTATION=